MVIKRDLLATMHVKQARVYFFVTQFHAATGRLPTPRQIGEHFKFAGANAAKHLRILKGMGCFD